MVPGSELRLRGVGREPDPHRPAAQCSSGWAATCRCRQRTAAGGEPVGDLLVRAAELQGTAVEPDEVPLVIDELPLVALLGVFAEGRTTVHGAEELRRKESDRIATVVEGLRGLGARIEAAPDGFMIEGTGGLEGGALDAAGDHRLAMLGAVAGLASREGVEVRGFEAAAVSYPGFADDLEGVPRRAAARARPDGGRHRSCAAARSRGAAARLPAPAPGRRRLALLLGSCSCGDAPRWSGAEVRRRRSRRRRRAAARRARVLPRHRVVAFYGAPQDEELGVLGTTTPQEAASGWSARRESSSSPAGP